jgi:hypothetical protein
MTEMVDLYVGPEKKHFRIHKALLCKKIPYFEKMFSGGFKECLEGVGTFPEDNPDSFDGLIKWVYSGALPTLFYIRDSKGEMNGNFSVLSLYVLLDKICLHRVMDELINCWIESAAKFGFLVDHKNLNWIYHWTREGSPLRKYALHSFMFVLHGLPHDKGWLAKHWPTSAVQELVVKHPSFLKDYLELVQKTPIGEVPKDPRIMSRCVFHQHGVDEECSLK